MGVSRARPRLSRQARRAPPPASYCAWPLSFTPLYTIELDGPVGDAPTLHHMPQQNCPDNYVVVAILSMCTTSQSDASTLKKVASLLVVTLRIPSSTMQGRRCSKLSVVHGDGSGKVQLEDPLGLLLVLDVARDAVGRTSSSRPIKWAVLV